MMTCLYEITVRALCPVDGSQDVYNTVLESAHEIRCEEIVAFVRTLATVMQTQERITQALAAEFRCKVTTVGSHSGVRTTVTVA